MDLAHQVAANLEIDTGKAEKGIGAILMASAGVMRVATGPRVQSRFNAAERP